MIVGSKPFSSMVDKYLTGKKSVDVNDAKLCDTLKAIVSHASKQFSQKKGNDRLMVQV